MGQGDAARGVRGEGLGTGGFGRLRGQLPNREVFRAKADEESIEPKPAPVSRLAFHRVMTHTQHIHRSNRILRLSQSAE
jgi:hypothetical protein